jgi:predicted O-linked N-acetylglucosamine transferase (SPINDLY family)
MSETILLSALQEITEGRSGLTEVITAATTLVAGGQPRLAEQLYKVWIGFNRNHPQAFVAYFNCASLQSDAGDLAGAKMGLEQALASNPDFYPAYINLGSALERLGEADQALLQWQTLVSRLPSVSAQNIEHKLTALKQIGRVLIDNRRSPPAEAWLRQALDVVAEQRDVLEQYVALRLAQCEWPIIAPWEGMSREVLMKGVSPLSMAAYTDDPLLQLATAKRYIEVAMDERDDAPDADRRNASIDLTGRRLRVGYVSSDLREHAIGYLMAELFELHDREKVEVFAYYCGVDPQGDLNARIRKAVEHWVDIDKMDDATAARRVAADGIDVLVDVNGLTRHARTGVFARRPAPVQVNWLGFPGSMGSPYHQYIIADDWIIPAEHEIYFSEKVVRLPCYQSNDRRRVVAERPTRAAVGLPEDAFVFCCFNGAQKFTRFTVDRWLEILRRTPNSVLWLLEGEAEINARLQAYAEAGGVARDRIVFAPKQANAFHLARYPLADLFLDTSPYGAHTTASDSLWMGVPVLTLSGRAFAARVCSSLVRAAGLPELICERSEDYVERAVELAASPAKLGKLKAKLENNRLTCDLFNMDKLAACLEQLYRQMCEAHARGEAPRPDLTNLDIYREIGAAEDHEAAEMAAHPDYHGFYLGRLRRRHRMRPIPPDGRLWTAAEIERAG